jgi:hypothetical protein
MGSLGLYDVRMERCCPPSGAPADTAANSMCPTTSQ